MVKTLIQTLIPKIKGINFNSHTYTKTIKGINFEEYIPIYMSTKILDNFDRLIQFKMHDFDFSCS